MSEDRPKFLIVYDKPSSSDYEGRTHYSSDADTHTADSAEDVVKFCVGLARKNMEYAIKVFKDGCNFNNCLEIFYDWSNPWWGTMDEYDEGAVNDEDIDKIKEGIKAGMDQLKIDRDEKKRKEEADRKARDRAEKKMEFERLKKELGE